MLWLCLQVRRDQILLLRGGEVAAMEVCRQYETVGVGVGSEGNGVISIEPRYDPVPMVMNL